MSRQRRLLILSAVKPFPGDSGQQLRVRNKIIALRKLFEVTFLTFTRACEVGRTKRALLEHVDHAIVLPSVTQRNIMSRAYHKLAGLVYMLATGLKPSNYLIGTVELSLRRIAESCSPSDYDMVLYEYWHAAETTALFRSQRVPCVLDMHNLLWQSWSRQLKVQHNPILRWLCPFLVAAYRKREEAAWQRFSALIAISEGEAQYVRETLPQKRVILAPMGTNLDDWLFRPSPAKPPRVAYYGGLGNPHNQRDALRCCRQIMPAVWSRYPESEIWLVGSNPSRLLLELADNDDRVNVTGFVPQVQEVLRTMTAVLCPFTGTFGFRSRIIESMALGVPVIVSPDAVWGMGIESQRGLLLAETDEEFASFVVKLLQESDWQRQQSKEARKQVEEKYSFEASYGKLASELCNLSCGPSDTECLQGG